VWFVWGVARGRSLLTIPQLTGVEMVVVGVEQDHLMFRCALKHFNENMEDKKIPGSKVSVILLTTPLAVPYAAATPKLLISPLIQC
jgi:hypothetical protein